MRTQSTKILATKLKSPQQIQRTLVRVPLPLVTCSGRGHTHDGLGPKSLKLDDIGPRMASRINEIDCLADFAIVIDADRGDDVCPRGHGALDGDLRLKVRDFELEL